MMAGYEQWLDGVRPAWTSLRPTLLTKLENARLGATGVLYISHARPYWLADVPVMRLAGLLLERLDRWRPAADLIARRPDTIVGFGETRIHAESATFELRASEIAKPRPGDQLTVGGETFVIQGEPERRDPDRLVWNLDARST
jgi:hypothetical protein